MGIIGGTGRRDLPSMLNSITHQAENACSTLNAQAAHTIAGLLFLSDPFELEEPCAAFPHAIVGGREGLFLVCFGLGQFGAMWPCSPQYNK